MMPLKKCQLPKSARSKSFFSESPSPKKVRNNFEQSEINFDSLVIYRHLIHNVAYEE